MNKPATTNTPALSPRWLTFAIHLLCLIIIFILPDVVLSKSLNITGQSWRMYSKSLIYVAVFYINYYLIIEHCINKSKWVLRLAVSNLALLIISLLLIAFIFIPPPARMSKPPHYSGSTEEYIMLRHATFLLREATMIILTVGLSVAMKLSDNWIKITRQHDQMLAIQRKEELESLKRQLNPHFLFNTLNSIYAQIALSPNSAQNAVHQLSSLLRYVLYENAPSVPLSKELDFINNYVKLMSMRIGNRLPVKLNLDTGGHDNLHIAPLIFICPVENAFKHGNTGMPDAEITISITCSNSIVECLIINHTAGNENIKNSGIGLGNLQRRLQLIYGERAKMTSQLSDNIFVFNLKIDLSSF